MSPRILLLLLALPLSAFAQEHEFQCGTTPEIRQQARELAEWSRQRSARMAAKELEAIDVRDGVFVVNADAANAPFMRLIDLAGKTLIFTRNGNDSYTARTTDLAYEENRGTITTGSYTLKGFAFPFFGKSVTQIYLSRNNAIYLSTAPTASDIDQLSDLEAATSRTAVIAPLLTTADNQGTIPTATYVRETADAVIVTWTDSRYDVQAMLAKNGEIRFHYKRADIRAASLLITSGDEPWRSRRTAIGTITDGSNDHSASVPASIAGMVDIESVTASRIAESNLLEFRIKTREALAASRIPTGSRVQVVVSVRGSSSAALNTLRYILNANGSQTYQIPAWGTISNSPAAYVDGQTIVMHVLQDVLPSVTSTLDFAATIFLGNTFGDGTSRSNVQLPAGQRQVRTDFSTLDGSRAIDGPIAEAFTLPILSVGQVWEQLKSKYGLRDDDIDGVAIYQNFFTNIVYYAGAYSTVGNSGARGYIDDPTIGPDHPREPALLHMNKIGFGPNRDLKASEHVSLHEFGHRWLFFLNFMDNGQRSTMLNPLGGHPAQWVDTRAAFPVYNSYDASAMGGGTFTENNDGTFSASPYGFYAYSWLDLYLMGLASPSEVPPFFYVANSNPALGNAYYAPDNITVTGQRKNVSIEQVVEAMGPRVPAYPNTQRTFKVAFVLLADPNRPVDPNEIALVNGYRAEMEMGFRVATGGRGTLVTTIATEPPPPPVRRRSVR